MGETDFSGIGFIENGNRNLQEQKGEVCQCDSRKGLCRLQQLEHTGGSFSLTKSNEPIGMKQVESYYIFIILQELALGNYREREVKLASKRWMLQTKPISSIFAYKDWVYIAGQGVEGSNIKVGKVKHEQDINRQLIHDLRSRSTNESMTQEWRRKYEVQTRISLERGACVSAIGVVEDFVYLCSSSSPSVLQVTWLRNSSADHIFRAPSFFCTSGARISRRETQYCTMLSCVRNA